MSVKLRLTRMGNKKRSFFRIVATNTASRRDGRPLEFLGYYNPQVSPADIKIDTDKVQKWMDLGAEMSDTVCQEGRRLVRLSVVQLFSDPVGLCGSARVVCLFLCCCEENGRRPSFLYPPHLLMGGEAPRQKFRRHAWRTHVFPKASAAESCFPSPNRTGTL